MGHDGTDDRDLLALDRNGSEVLVDISGRRSDHNLRLNLLDVVLLRGRRCLEEDGLEGNTLADENGQLLLVGGLGEDVTGGIHLYIEVVNDLDDGRERIRDGGHDGARNRDEDLTLPNGLRRNGEASNAAHLVSEKDLLDSASLPALIRIVSSVVDLGLEFDDQFLHILGSAMIDRDVDRERLAHIRHLSRREFNRDLLIASKDRLGLLRKLDSKGRMKLRIFTSHCQLLSHRLIDRHGNIDVALNIVVVLTKASVEGGRQVEGKHELERIEITTRRDLEVLLLTALITVESGNGVEEGVVSVEVDSVRAALRIATRFSPVSFGATTETNTNSADLSRLTNVVDDGTTNNLSREVDDTLDVHTEGTKTNGLGFGRRESERRGLDENMNFTLSIEGQPHIETDTSSDARGLELGHAERNILQDAIPVIELQSDVLRSIGKSKYELFVPLLRLRTEEKAKRGRSDEEKKK